MIRLIALVFSGWWGAAAIGAATAQDGTAELCQIDWQPDLAAAIALAKAEGRPLFLALNMDGESASERVVREQYRDPEFVALTRHCVNVMGSLFRHTPRDYDDAGRRIPSPRLGAVTSGELIALEPQIYEYLGGERIAPRHALILPDGTKVFDHSLLFDMKDMVEDLRDAVEKYAPPPRNTPLQSGSAGDAWRVLLRDVVARPGTDPAGCLKSLGELAKTRGVTATATGALLQLLRDVPALPVPKTFEAVPGLMLTLADVDGESPTTRTTLLAWFALGHSEAQAALATAFGGAQGEELARGLPESERAYVSRYLSLARSITQMQQLEPRITPPRQAADVLMAELDAALTDLRTDSEAPEKQARVGLASMRLARARIESGNQDVGFLLSDAENFLRKAVAAMPDDLLLATELARTLYLTSQFEEEEKVAQAAWSRLPPLSETLDSATLANELRDPPARHNVLRWVGDASARLLWGRQGGDPLVEAKGIAQGARALLLAAASPCGDDVDWQSAASFFRVLGLMRQHIAILDEGLRRFPTSNVLRSDLSTAFATLGRPELILEHAQGMNDWAPSAESSWYLAQAYSTQGEWLRRMERPDEAIVAYGHAVAAFAASESQNPAYGDGARYYRAMCTQGIGFAHLLAQRQEDAARALVAAVAIDGRIKGMRDGLDRESYDLVDQCLEWRIGRPSPADERLLLGALLHAEPDTPYWAVAIADTMLREGLRADGRRDPALGDVYLARGIEVSERAWSIAQTDETRFSVAQNHTVVAERHLEAKDAESAWSHLVRAAPLQGLEAPAESATLEELTALAEQLRSMLGDARPRERVGR